MKFRVIGLVIIGLFAMYGVVSAASSMWGTYKGNPIMRLTVDGSPVTVSDVPAISYNDRTMIPIYLLKQAGINYTYDAQTKTVNIITGSTTKTPTTPTIPQPSNPAPVGEAFLYSYDEETYLGKLTTNEYDSESVFNQYGDYGSKYSSTSIWNTYGDYGSKYSNTSAFNPYATEPPIIVENNEVVGYVTANAYLTNAVHPDDLRELLEEIGY